MNARAIEQPTGSILREAMARGIPWRRMLRRSAPVGLGQGAHRLILRGVIGDRDGALPGQVRAQ